MKTQKRMAAEILKIGKTRVHVDPDMTTEVESAMTRGDIRKYIGLGFIKKKPAKSNSRGRKRARDAQKKKGRQRGQGKRKGKQRARKTKKETWMEKIRAQRKMLRELKDAGKLDTRAYRELYKKAKAGVFKNKAHLKRYVGERGLGDIGTGGHGKPKAKPTSPAKPKSPTQVGEAKRAVDAKHQIAPKDKEEVKS